MFRNPNMSQIEIMAKLLDDRVQIKNLSPLSRAIYREMTLSEPETIEKLLEFYNSDKQHEQLMNDIASEAAMAVSGFLSKIENEIFDLIDTTLEEVEAATKDVPTDIITHKLKLVPELKFLDSNLCQEQAAVRISHMARVAVPSGHGGKFEERTDQEIMNRISKTMSGDTFALFGEFVRLSGFPISKIYDFAVRGLENKIPPLKRIGDLGLPYTHLEALVGYHIVDSLMQEVDEETRLTELEYNNFIAAKRNNLMIRYKTALDSICARLEDPQGKLLYEMDGDTVILTVYEPTLVRVEGEREDTNRQMIIEEILDAIILKEKGPLPGKHELSRYQHFRKEVTARNSLKLSQSKMLEVNKSLERFVNGRHFNTWWNANVGGEPTDAQRLKTMDNVRRLSSTYSVATESELYGAIIDIVANGMYQNPAIRAFINELRVILASGDVTVHEALGLTTERAVIKYFTEMFVTG